LDVEREVEVVRFVGVFGAPVFGGVFGLLSAPTWEKTSAHPVTIKVKQSANVRARFFIIII
jgi:hypothetical protein